MTPHHPTNTDYTIRFSDFLKQPKEIGAFNNVGISSVEKAFASTDRKKIHRILEIGAGKGNITDYLLQHKTAESTLEVCEINAEFCDLLTQRFGNQIVLHRGDVLDWDGGTDKYDLIVSTIPMTQMDSTTREQIIEKVADLLTSTGTYIHLQYSHFLVKWLKKQFRHVDYTYNRKDFPFTCIMTAKQN